MKYSGKNLSIIILSSGYWRSGLLKSLFSDWALIKRVNLKKEDINPSELNKYDIVLWEDDIQYKFPIDSIEEKKLFLFNYKDDGNINSLQELARLMQLKSARFLLLLNNKKDKYSQNLPLPAPKLINKRFGVIKDLKTRKNNINFLCSPTYIITDSNSKLPYSVKNNGQIYYNQRIEWANSLSNKKMLYEGMGLVEPKNEYLKKESICRLFNCDSKLFTNFLSKKEYVKLLLNSKIVLAPGGHSRWTYRHIEGMFYNSLVISTDLTNFRTIPQLPQEAMITISDGEFDPKLINDILENIEDYQPIADMGYEFARKTYQPKTIFSKGGYTKEAAKKMFETLIHWFDKQLKR